MIFTAFFAFLSSSRVPDRCEYCVDYQDGFAEQTPSPDLLKLAHAGSFHNFYRDKHWTGIEGKQGNAMAEGSHETMVLKDIRSPLMQH